VIGIVCPIAPLFTAQNRKIEAEAYLGRSLLFRHLKNGPHGQLVERCAARLVEERLAQQGIWRCLNVVSHLLDWSAERRCKLADIGTAPRSSDGCRYCAMKARPGASGGGAVDPA
jgi:hypothetical protein